MDFLGYSMYKIISSTHGDWFTFSCLIFMPFISLAYLIALARTSSTTLSRSSKSWYSFLRSDLRRKVSSLSSLNIMLAVGFFICLFSKCLYQTEEVPSMLSLLSVFIMESVLVFSGSVDVLIWFLSFIFSIDMKYYIEFWTLNQPCIPETNSSWSRIILFIHCWVWFDIILLRLFETI